MPSCPKSFLPQQYRPPSVPMPQVCPQVDSPRAGSSAQRAPPPACTVAKLIPPGVATYTGLAASSPGIAAPLPSCPTRLAPTHCRVPEVGLTLQLWALPAPTASGATTQVASTPTVSRLPLLSLAHTRTLC